MSRRFDCCFFGHFPVFIPVFLLSPLVPSLSSSCSLSLLCMFSTKVHYFADSPLSAILLPGIHPSIIHAHTEGNIEERHFVQNVVL